MTSFEDNLKILTEIIISEEFKSVQNKFIEENCNKFKDSEENDLS